MKIKKSSKQPFFSIIIPAYNEEKLLKKCLTSVFKQNFPQDQFEVIVVDNNSTDKTLSIAKKFPVVIAKEKIQGIVAARNKGFLLAKGKIIVNLDADCQVFKNWLTKYQQHFLKNKHLVAMTGPYLTNSKKIDLLLTRLQTFCQQKLNFTCGYWGGNIAINKESLKAIGGYDMRFVNADQLSLLFRLKKSGGKVGFDSNLAVLSSNRRLKKRPWQFSLEIISYFLNIVSVNLFNKSILYWENIRN